MMHRKINGKKYKWQQTITNLQPCCACRQVVDCRCNMSLPLCHCCIAVLPTYADQQWHSLRLVS